MTDALLQLARKSTATRLAKHDETALMQAGFRPFFFLAAVVAPLSVLTWLALLRGALVMPGASVDLHVHEMIFGFAAAVIAGFLLTAVRNWTGVSPAPPRVLAGLVSLYVAGRVAVVIEAAGIVAGASIVEVLFLPSLVIAIARPIARSRDRRNFGVVAIVAALAVVDVTMHVAAWTASPTLAQSARSAALLLPCVLVAVIGGRVIPLFTRNVVTNDTVTVREPSTIDTIALVAMVVVLLAAVAAPWSPAVSAVEPVIDLAAGALLLLRMRGWASRHTLRRPILWVLHVGFACLGVGLCLRALPALVPPTVAAHLLGLGAIALTSLGMMTRVALGHTGRGLVLPRIAIAGYAALVAALAVRVAAAWQPALLEVAGGLFALAFLAFVASYWRVLVEPRADGKPG